MTAEVSLLAASVAGLLSISSPCVLPLVPIYLAHLAGVGSGRADAATRRRLVANAAASVAVFSLVFVSLGAAGGLVETGSLVAGNRIWHVRLGGAVLVVLG